MCIRDSVGTVLTASGMALDFQSYVRHLAPRTTSAVQALALARDRAQVVLNTHAHIAAGCDDANVHQLLTGIPVHGEPRLTLRPHMEILHDQVQATHGATWGALPEDALFYAQQRGIANQVARGLIVRGMASDLLTRAIDDDALSEQLNAAGRHRLPGLRNGEVVGAATGNSVKLAIRDTGMFMDPRACKDWWMGYMAQCVVQRQRPDLAQGPPRR